MRTFIILCLALTGALVFAALAVTMVSDVGADPYCTAKPPPTSTGTSWVPTQVPSETPTIPMSTWVADTPTETPQPTPDGPSPTWTVRPTTTEMNTMTPTVTRTPTKTPKHPQETSTFTPYPTWDESWLGHGSG